MNTVRAFHAYVAYVVIAVNLVVALWGLWMYRAKRKAPKVFWAGVITGHASLVTQVGAGLVLWQVGDIEPPGQHTFYGFVLLIASALSIQFIAREPRRKLLAFSLFALFLGSVGIRTYFTA
jgi:hypothetical protein